MLLLLLQNCQSRNVFCGTFHGSCFSPVIRHTTRVLGNGYVAIISLVVTPTLKPTISFCKSNYGQLYLLDTSSCMRLIKSAIPLPSNAIFTLSLWVKRVCLDDQAAHQATLYPSLHRLLLLTNAFCIIRVWLNLL